MIIDCDTCTARDTTACDDCIVTVLCSDGVLELDDDERAALDAMSDAGLVSPIRLVTGPRPGRREPRLRHAGPSYVVRTTYDA